MAAKLDHLLEPINAPDAPGGAIIVIKDGKVLYKKAVGLANLEDKIANEPATNFRLASVTKQFTAMAVLMLIEDGKLAYDTKLGELFPRLPEEPAKITIRQVLSHTGGLLAYEDFVPDSAKQVKDRDVLDILSQHNKTYFTPGSKYRYSNSGYALLALAAEKASGQKFPEFLKKRIFAPIGMKNTLAYEEGGPEIPNRAFGYTKRGNGFKRTDQSSTSAVLGDGGIYSSVEDMAKWDQALYKSKLVRPETLALAMTREKLNSGRAIDYGFGWYVEDYLSHPCIRHGGSTIGFRNEIERFPDLKLTVILLCNRADAKPQEIVRKVVAALLEKRS